MTITDKEVQELISQVESEFKALAKSESESKSEDKKEESKEEPKKEESKEEAKESKEEKKEEMKKDEQPEMEAQPEESAPEAPAEEHPEMEGEGQEDEYDLEQIYCDMSEEEREMHYEALMAAMQKSWSQEDMPEEQPSEEQAPQMEAPSEEPKPEMDMGKKELTPHNGNLPHMKKTEDEDMKKLKDENDSLNKALETLVKSLESKIPARKDAVEIIAKSEPESLEKSETEVYTEAKELAKTEGLTKFEREKLNHYFTDRTKVQPVIEILKQKSQKA